MKNLLFFLSVLYVANISAQNNYVKLYTGQAYYQGDLSPSAVKFSFSPGQFTYGIGYSRQINDWFNLGVDVMRGEMSASDEDSINKGRKQRNLSFYSDFMEYSLTTEINLVELLIDTSLYGVDIYYKTGIGLLNIDPKTLLNGQEYILRDYSTEGQGLPGGGEKYGTNHIVIPFGISFRFDLTDQISIGVDALSRWTFTDYLDDVSGSYPDLELLESNLGRESVMLSYRIGNLDQEDYEGVQGGIRGNPSNNDWYTYIGVSFQYKWSNQEKSSQEKVN